MNNKQTHTRNLLARNDKCVNSFQLCRHVSRKFSLKISKYLGKIKTSILKHILRSADIIVGAKAGHKSASLREHPSPGVHPWTLLLPNYSVSSIKIVPHRPTLDLI